MTTAGYWMRVGMVLTGYVVALVLFALVLPSQR